MKYIKIIFILLFFLENDSGYSQIAYNWAKGLSGGSNEVGNNITLDAAGNSYLIGYFTGTTDFDPGAGVANLTSTGLLDVFIAKYDPTGSYIWAKKIGGTDTENGYCIQVDAANNIYISGSFASTADFDPGAGVANLTSAGLFDVFFAKYDAGGNYVWAKNIGGAASEFGASIALDATGNIYLTGSFNGIGDYDPSGAVVNLPFVGSSDIFFAKYDPAGNYIWAKSIGGLTSDVGRSIYIDASNNVYISGYFVAGVIGGLIDFDPGIGVANINGNNSPDMYVGKYDSNGNYIWANGIGGASSAVGDAWDIMGDAAGNIYITGNFSGTDDFDPGPGVVNITAAPFFDFYIAKYDSNGNYVWAHGIGGSGSEYTFGIFLDGTGVYTSGYFQNTVDFDPGAGVSNLTCVGTYDIFFAKYDLNGNYVWAKGVGSTAGDQSSAIAVDGTGNVFITGNYSGIADFDPDAPVANLTSVGAFDAFVAKYSPSLVITSHPADSTVCESNNVSFSVTATGALTYQWQESTNGGATFNNIINGGIYSNATTPTLNITGVTAAMNGYQYRCVVSNGSTTVNSNVAILTVIISPLITGQPIDAIICEGDNANLIITATGAGLNYQWQVNPGSGFSNLTNTAPYSNVTTSQLTITGVTSGMNGYMYRCIVAGTCPPLDTSVTVTITVNPLPVITITPVSDTICYGASTTLTANGGVNYTWNPTTGLNPQTSSPVVASPTSDITYIVTGIDVNGCENTATSFIKVFPQLVIDAGTDQTILSGESVNLTSTSGFNSYNWIPATGLSCTNCQNPTASPTQSTLYCVTVTDANDCSDSACVKINVELQCGEVFVPSAFSPNNDNENELVCVFGKCMQSMTFIIFDRWGEKVFESSDPKICWDGRFKGKLMNSAVFIYSLDGTLNTGEKISKKGNISLIR